MYINHSSLMSGAEVSLVSLLRNLDPERYIPVVVLPGEGTFYDELKDGFHVEIVPMRRFKRIKNPFLLLAYLINVCRAIRQISVILRKENIQLIHSNSTNAHIFGGIAGWIKGVPSLWHVRDVVPLGVLGKILFFLSERIIVPSRFVKGTVLEYVGKRREDRIVTVYNGVDLLVLSQEAEQKTKSGGHSARNGRQRVKKGDSGTEGSLREVYGFAPNIPLIAMIGQLVPWKRQDDFIRVAEKVLSEVPSANFFIVGEDLFDDHPTYKVELKKMVNSLGIEDKVIFIEYCHNILSFLNGIDILVHPARVEPFGRVIVEAMAMERPVVAIRNGGPTEIVEDRQTGYLVPPGDIERMVRAVIDLIRNPNLRKEMGERGKMRVEEKFSIKLHACEIMEVYEYCH